MHPITTCIPSSPSSTWQQTPREEFEELEELEDLLVDDRDDIEDREEMDVEDSEDSDVILLVLDPPHVVVQICVANRPKKLKSVDCCCTHVSTHADELELEKDAGGNEEKLVFPPTGRHLKSVPDNWQLSGVGPPQQPDGRRMQLSPKPRHDENEEENDEEEDLEKDEIGIEVLPICALKRDPAKPASPAWRCGCTTNTVSAMAAALRNPSA